MRGSDDWRRGMSDLKPCPFCGSDHLIYNSASGIKTGRFVRCADCGTSGPTEEDDARAKAAWNEAPRRNEVVELPEDADGVPIQFGEAVYDIDGDECVVRSITMTVDGWRIGVYGKCSGFILDSLHPSRVTHVAPDSLESIEKDIYHLVMSECLDDPEADVKAIMERIKKLTKEEE